MPDTDAAIEERLASLTLEEKVELLTGADAWSLPPSERIGLRTFVMSDGPVGVRGTVWDERDTSANLPSPTALAASWDEQLVHRLGLLLAAEARRKGVDMLLAPTVNLHRSPLGGRHFECYSEDPLLTSRIGVAYVRGVQEGGVAATVKHFVGNDSETQRMTVDVRMDRRALRELYLAPFEAIVREGGAWAVMAAYNAVDGTTMTESPLLADILRQEWGFDGVVVSDWTAARSTEASARAALDLVMPGPNGPWGALLVTAVREGKVPEEAVDEKVRRLLRVAARTGALADGPAAVEPPVFLDEDVSALVREAAAGGFVLARNDDLLPLAASGLRQVAVLGPNADSARTQGGGSATVFPPYVVSPLEGLRTALGDAGVEVVHTPGARASSVLPPLASAAHVRFLDEAGNTVGEEDRDTTRFLWLGSYGPDIDVSLVRTVEVTATLRAVDSGEHGIGIQGTGHFEVHVGDQVVIDETLSLPEGSEEFEAVVRPPHTSARTPLSGGTEALVRVVHTVPEHPFVAFAIGHDEPRRSDADELAAAVELAAASDVAVVVVGTTAEIESEGFDRSTLALPGGQDELVRAVAAANPRTIVVVNAGSPVELPWADSVGAVVLAWFPGQEFGNALADVLLGVREPGGRLPTTWPVVAADCPVLSTTPVDGVLSYDESLHVGYRGWARSERKPRYAFGHGLGYTTWECVDASWPVAEQVRVTVRNTGSRAGRTVVQAYLSKPDSEIDRPALWLAGFAVVEADAGATAEAEVLVSPRAFEHWDEEAGEWRTEAGPFALAIGPASDVVWRRLSAS